MGSSLNKDKHLKVVTILDKNVYFAGQMLTGSVCLQVSAFRPYKYLYIIILGQENVCWSERYGQVTVTYSQNRQTYREQFLLAKFNQTINIGQYSFPFKVLLPSTLSGTLKVPTTFSMNGALNFIKYSIRAYLPPFDEDSQMQAFDCPINLRQPLRFQQSLMIENNMQYTSCFNCCKCCCCNMYPSGYFSFQLNKNQFFYNQEIKARGFIDNSQGTADIQNYKFVISEKITQVASTKSRCNKKIVGILQQFNQTIKVGQRKDIFVTMLIPNTILGNTAIGNIIARNYYIQLIGNIGCCYKDLVLSKHIIINNNFVEPQKEEITKFFMNFNPIRQGQISFINLSPYMYNPEPPIVDINQTNLLSLMPQNRNNGNLFQPNLRSPLFPDNNQQKGYNN